MYFWLTVLTRYNMFMIRKVFRTPTHVGLHRPSLFYNGRVSTHVLSQLCLGIVVGISSELQADTEIDRLPHLEAKISNAAHKGPIRALSYSTRGDRMAFAAQGDKRIAIYDSDIVRELDRYSHVDIWGIQFEHHGGKLALCGTDDVAVWDSEQRTARLFVIPRQRPSIAPKLIGPLLTPDDKWLIAADRTAVVEPRIYVWSTETGKIERTLVGHPATVTALDLVRGRSEIVSGDFAGNVLIWDIGSGGIVQRLRESDGIKRAEGMAGFGQLFGSIDAVTAIASCPSDRRIVAMRTVVPHNVQFDVWRAETDTAAWKHTCAASEAVNSYCRGPLVFAPTGGVIAVSASRKRALLIETIGGEAIAVCEHPKDAQLDQIVNGADELTALAFSPDGRTLATGDVRGRIVLFDVPERILQGKSD
jgi:WD40 repeat protein